MADDELDRLLEQSRQIRQKSKVALEEAQRMIADRDVLQEKSTELRERTAKKPPPAED